MWEFFDVTFALLHDTMKDNNPKDIHRELNEDKKVSLRPKEL